MEEWWEKRGGAGRVGRDVQYAHACCGNILHQLITGQSKCGAGDVIPVLEIISLSGEWSAVGASHLSDCHQWRFAGKGISHLLLEHPHWSPVINSLTSNHSAPLIFLYSDLRCLITTLIRLRKRSMCVCCQLLSCTCLFHTHSVARLYSPEGARQ